MHLLDRDRLVLLDRLIRRMEAAGEATDDVRAAVDVLTADANPERADRLAVRPGEPPVLVQRLAVWALHRSSDAAVAAAGWLVADDATEPLPVAVGEARAAPGPWTLSA